MKLANNMLSRDRARGDRRGDGVATKAASHPRVALDILNASSGRNSANSGEVPPVGADGTFDFGFLLKLMLKDVKLFEELAEELAVPTIVAESVANVWRIVSRWASAPRTSPRSPSSTSAGGGGDPRHRGRPMPETCPEARRVGVRSLPLKLPSGTRRLPVLLPRGVSRHPHAPLLRLADPRPVPIPSSWTPAASTTTPERAGCATTSARRRWSSARASSRPTCPSRSSRTSTTTIGRTQPVPCRRALDPAGRSGLLDGTLAAARPSGSRRTPKRWALVT